MWLPHYQTSYEVLEKTVYDGLLNMSAATIDSLLACIKVHSRHGLYGTKPGRILKKHIPIKTDQWDEHIPGFLEADTVAHCGTAYSDNVHHDESELVINIVGILDLFRNHH
jgi:hypothetical protein